MTAPIKTENVLPQPVGAFTSPLFLSIMCCHVCCWNKKGWWPLEESQLEMIQKLELSREDHAVLIQECSAHGIGFFSTAFDFQSFDLLMELGCLKQVKIPSGELTNLPLLRYMSRFGKPLLLSTGMANLGEIEAAIEAVEAAGSVSVSCGKSKI